MVRQRIDQGQVLGQPQHLIGRKPWAGCAPCAASGSGRVWTGSAHAAAISVIRPDGTRGRKWVYGQTRVEVARKLADIAQRINAEAVMPTRSPTVGEYLDYWLAEVAMPRLRPTTIAKYRIAIELYLRPALGTQKLDQLTVVTVHRFLNTSRAAGDPVQKLRWIRLGRTGRCPARRAAGHADKPRQPAAAAAHPSRSPTGRGSATAVGD
jgi:Phage integrase, N-terminal SAM-like domain